MDPTTPIEDEPTTVAHPAHTATDLHTSLGSLGDECSNCGASLATDQRYCVECGERRAGRPRPATATTAVTAAVPAVRRTARTTANATLVAGIGTLLLAMGVGVLIGRSGQKSANTRAANPVQVVTVAGGGATPTAGTAGSSAKKSAAKTKAPKATQGLKAALGGGKPPPKAVVKVGDKGHGPGYQHGHFTGNFFGPG